MVTAPRRAGGESDTRSGSCANRRPAASAAGRSGRAHEAASSTRGVLGLGARIMGPFPRRRRLAAFVTRSDVVAMACGVGVRATGALGEMRRWRARCGQMQGRGWAPLCVMRLPIGGLFGVMQRWELGGDGNGRSNSHRRESYGRYSHGGEGGESDPFASRWDF